MAIELSITGASGDSISLEGPDFFAKAGTRGFGIPTPVLRIDPSASNGGTFRYSKRDIREIDLPITILGDTQSETEEKARRLANILQGPATLTATYDTGDVWALTVYYAGGGETQFGQNGSDHFCSWDLILKAPQPFWESTTPFSISIIQDTTTRGLLAGSTPKTLSKLRVKTSQAFGNISITNDGDVDAPMVWTIQGPSTNASFSLNGVGFSFTQTLTSADTITIDCEAGTVTDQTGANRYAGLSSAPKLFNIPPGDAVLSINVTGATSATKVRGYFSPRREVLH